MKELIIACSMLEDEVRLAMERSHCRLPVIWMERGLHEYPDKLRAALQEQIDQAEAERILLAYGLCGNALLNVSAGERSLVLPHFDDCIRMLLCHEPGQQAAVPDTLYFTDSWFRSKDFLVNQFWRCAARLGERKARRAYDAMLKNYHGLCLINTGAYDMTDARARAGEAADLFGLALREESGTVRILTKLFSHQWDEEFLILQPGEIFTLEMFMPCLAK